MSKQRQSDELTLKMLDLRSRSVSPTQIAERIGSTSQFVSTATNRVRRADQDESGEPLEVVNAGYW